MNEVGNIERGRDNSRNEIDRLAMAIGMRIDRVRRSLDLGRDKENLFRTRIGDTTSFEERTGAGALVAEELLTLGINRKDITDEQIKTAILAVNERFVQGTK